MTLVRIVKAQLLDTSTYQHLGSCQVLLVCGVASLPGQMNFLPLACGGC